MNWMTPAALEPLAWTLLHFLWQGMLAALLIAGGLALMPRRQANLRYLWSVAGLGCMALLPLFTWVQLSGDGSAPGASLETFLGTAATAVEPEAMVATQGTAMAAAAHPSLAQRLEPILPWCLALWLAGVVTLSIFHLGGWLRLRALERRARPLAARWRQRGEALCRSLGLGRAIRFLESDQLTVPAVFGWLRPAVLVPANALAGLSPRQLEAILAHELAHVRRHDYLVNLLQVALETLLFYHPAVWWISNQVRQEREHCCDDLAVAACGDAAFYVRSLTELEASRPPAFALGAHGGSLLGRVRRLLGRDHPRPGSWRALAAVSSLLLCAALGYTSLARPAAGAGESGDSVTGKWKIKRSLSGDVQLQLEHKERNRKWKATFSLDDDELIDGPGGLEYRHEGGTFHLDGATAGERGSGTFRFVASQDYLRELARLGYPEADKRVFDLVIHDITTDYIVALQEAGFEGVPLKKVIEARIHGIDAEYALGMGEAGYDDLDIDKLIEVRIHGVSPEYASEMAEAGYEDLNIRKLLELRIHGVDPNYAARMADAGYDDLDIERLLELRIHGVDPEYAARMAEAGYEDLDIGKLLEMRVHGVDPEYAARMTEAGYEDLDIDKLLEMRIHGVDPEYAARMAEAGYEDLDIDRLIELRIHGIQPEYAVRMAEAGYQDLETAKLLELRTHGVDPEYAARMAEAGLEDLDIDDLLALRIQGLSPEYVTRMAESGFKDVTVKTLMEMRIHGVSPEFVEDMIAAGYDGWSARKLIELRIHGIDSQYVRDLAEAGYGDLSPEELTQLRVHGVTGSFIRQLADDGYTGLSPEEIIEMRILGGRKPRKGGS